MTAAHKEILRSKKSQLSEGMTNISKIYDRLAAGRILSDEECKNIREGHINDTDKARDLVETVLRKEDRAFTLLVEAFEKEGNPQLAKLLRDAGSRTS